MKLIIKLLAFAVIGLVLLVVAGMFLAPPAGKKAIEAGTSFALGLPAEVNDVQLGLGTAQSEFGFENLEIANPAGFGDTPFMSIGKLNVQVGTMSVVSDVIDVPSVELEGLTLELHQSLDGNNFEPIWKHVKELVQRYSSDSESEPAPASEEPEASSEGPKINVGKVRVAGVTGRFVATLSEDVQKDWSYTLPAFEMDFAGQDKAPGTEEQTVAELTARVVDFVLERSMALLDDELPPELKVLLQSGTEGLGDLAGQEAQALLDEEGGKLREKLGEEGAKLKDKASKELKGLFDKD